MQVSLVVFILSQLKLRFHVGLYRVRLERRVSRRNEAINELGEGEFEPTSSSTESYLLTKYLKEGKLKPRETIVDGFDNIPKALTGLFTGENIGKMVVKCEEEGTFSFEK